MTVLTTLAFDSDDQQAFAQLSGDWNPIHLPSHPTHQSAASEGAVVHGVNTALKALDAVAAHLPNTKLQYSTISVRFSKPVFVDERVELHVSRDQPSALTLSVMRHGVELVRISLSNPDTIRPSSGAGSIVSYCDEPRLRSIDEPSGQEGAFAIDADGALLARHYPNLLGVYGGRRIAGLVRLSTVIGMDWPGRYSLLSDLKINLKGGDSLLRDFQWRVDRTDKRLGLTVVNGRAPDFGATINAFFRPEPVRQPAYVDIQGLVETLEFRSISALIVGGSRGMGEVAAKLIAAGGGLSQVTYRTGKAQAEAVVEEILAGGGKARAIHFDTDTAMDLASAAPEFSPPDLLVYCASPKIFRRRTAVFDTRYFREFTDVYVDGFIATVSALRERSKQRLAILYPSTVALDKPIPDLTEYIAAKGAGEALCAVMTATDSLLNIEVPRLPRLSTEQTNSVIRASASDAASITLPLLRKLAQLASETN